MAFQLSRQQEVSPSHKRVHVYFNHSGCPAFLFGGKNNIYATLRVVLSQFGEVTSTYFHAEYSYCFVTYATHEKAQKAIRGLNDVAVLRAAIASVVNRQTGGAKALVKRISDYIFVEKPLWGLAKASWAAPRR